MSKGFEIEFRNDHVHIQLEPEYEFDPAGSEEIWARLKELCREHATSRVFVEGFVPPGERKTEEVVAAGERTAAVPRLWLAFHLENFVRSEQSELFEVIAASRGVRVKFFADREHALMWLRNNAPS